MNKWQKKAAKYKAKYLTLKKQLGGIDSDPDLKFMTSKIDPIKYKDFYLSQNLFLSKAIPHEFPKRPTKAIFLANSESMTNPSTAPCAEKGFGLPS